MPDGNLQLDAPTPDADRELQRALRRFRWSRAAFVLTGLVYLFVLTSGLPVHRSAVAAAAVTTPTTAVPGVPGAGAGGGATTVPVASSTTLDAPSPAAPLTWDDVVALPLGTTEDALRRRAAVCSTVSEHQVGDQTERQYSCKGAHENSAVHFTVAGGVVTQRTTSNLRGERDAATMTPELFAKLTKGMTEAEALAIAGPCDLGAELQSAAGRVASWTCHGPANSFVVVVIERGVVHELIDSLTR